MREEVEKWAANTEVPWTQADGLCANRARRAVSEGTVPLLPLGSFEHGSEGGRGFGSPKGKEHELHQSQQLVMESVSLKVR